MVYLAKYIILRIYDNLEPSQIMQKIQMANIEQSSKKVSAYVYAEMAHHHCSVTIFVNTPSSAEIREMFRYA